MGANIWREEDDWPILGLELQIFFSAFQQQSESARGNGSLSIERPNQKRPINTSTLREYRTSPLMRVVPRIIGVCRLDIGKAVGQRARLLF